MDPGLGGSGGGDPDPLQHAFPVPQRTRRTGCLPRGGCGLGCLFVVILMIVSTAASIDWMLAETAILPAEAMIDASTTTFQSVVLSPQNPGVKGLVSYVLDRATRRPEEHLGPYSAEYIHVLVPFMLRSLFPMQAVQLRRASHGHETPASAIISFGHTFVTPFLMSQLEAYLLRGQLPRETYRGCPVLAVPAADFDGTGLYVTCWQNNLAVSTSEPEVKRAVDRLIRIRGAFQGSGALAVMYHRLDPEADVRGVVVNRNGDLRRLLHGLLDRRGGPLAGLVRPSLLDQVAVGVDTVGYEAEVVSEDRTDVHVLVTCKGDSVASRLRGFLEAAGDRLVAAGLAADRLAIQNGSLVEFRLRLIAVRGMVDRALGLPPPAAETPASPESAAPGAAAASPTVSGSPSSTAGPSAPAAPPAASASPSSASPASASPASAAPPGIPTSSGPSASPSPLAASASPLTAPAPGAQAPSSSAP